MCSWLQKARNESSEPVTIMLKSIPWQSSDSVLHQVQLSHAIGSLQTVQQDCKDDNLTTCDRYGFADTRRLGAGVGVVVKPSKSQTWNGFLPSFWGRIAEFLNFLF